MITVPEEVKDLFHLDSCKKNIRIHFPDGERADICNNLIVKNSVSFTESLCSQDTLKFGLCEASVFECETVGVGNIKGAKIEVLCEIFCDSDVDGAEWRTDLEAYVFPVPYGVFRVDSCQRQADMNHRKIVAYDSCATRFDETNPIQQVRDNYGLGTINENRDAYQPLIFDINMQLLGISKRLSNATYTEMSDVVPYGEAIVYIPVSVGVSPRFPDLKRVFGVKAKSYRLPNISDKYDLDRLFYCEMPKSNISAESIKNTFLSLATGSSSVRETIEIALKNAGDKWLGCGLGYRTSGSTSDQKKHLYEVFGRNITRFQEGNYIYPYQYCSGYSSGRFNDLSEQRYYSYQPCILVPFGAFVDTYTFDWDEHQPSNYIQFRDPDEINVYQVDTSAYSRQRLYLTRNKRSANKAGTFYNYDPSLINYLESLNAVEELSGTFGRATKDNAFKEINIKQQFHLLPDSELYPSASLYPEGVTGGTLLPQDYRSCWYDDDYTNQYGAIHCTYKDSSNNEIDYIYYLDGFGEETAADSYKVYELSDNTIICDKLWTESQIETICEAIAENISGVTYMPVDFVGRGLPYVEAGDTFEILTRSNDSITTIVLNRTLTGEQTLVDSYKSV